MIWIGMIFLLIDTKIDGLLFYPAFEPFETNAPITVDLIIGHLIGDSVKLDIFSDLVAYILIILAASRIVSENQKLPHPELPASDPRLVLFLKKSAGAFRAFLLAVIALILYAANWSMPFFLNGSARYSAGFFLYIAYNLLKCLATIQAGLVCTRMAECLENHAWNNVVAIFIMLSSFAGFIRAMSYFYDLLWTTRIYYALQVFFAVLYTVMFWKRRSYVNSGVRMSP